MEPPHEQAPAAPASSPGAVIDLLRSAQLDLVLPSDDCAFEQARRVWNADIDRRPAAIVRCRSSQDVACAVGCCVSCKVDCTVRGGGHNVAGLAVHDGAVLLDLSQLSHVQLAAGSEQVAVGGGATWAAVDAATTAASRAVPAGLISHTGVGGLTLGGGVGWLSRHAGLTCDSLISAEVVIASGEVLIATKDQHSDLFWALHGGGGNFGVVTQFVFRTTTVSGVCMRQYTWETSDALRKCTILEQVAAMCEQAPSSTSIYSFLQRQLVMILAVQLLGVAEAGAVDAPSGCFAMLDQMGATWKTPLETKSLAALNSSFDEGNAPGKCYRWSRSTFIDASPGLTSDTIADLVRAVHESDTDGTAGLNVQLTHLGGAVSSQSPTATPFPHRSAVHEIHGIVTWAPLDHHDPGPRKLAAIRAFSDAMKRIGSNTGYVNIQPRDEQSSSTADWLHRAYAQNLPRLQKVKRMYDPHNFFHHNHNVTPDVIGECSSTYSEWRPVQPSLSTYATEIRSFGQGPPEPPPLPAHLKRTTIAKSGASQMSATQTTCRWRCCFGQPHEPRALVPDQVDSTPASTGDLRAQLQEKLATGLAPVPVSDDDDRFSTGYWCDVCSSRISSTQDWYRCSECEDFDACLSCFELHLHEHPCWREVALARRPAPGSVGPTCCDLVLHSLNVYRDRYCLGACDELEPSGVRWITYQEVERRAKGLACSMQADVRDELGGCSSAEEYMVGIFGENCTEWLLTDLCCILSGTTSIPMDPPIAEASIASMIVDCTLRTIFCSFRCLRKLLAIVEASSSSGAPLPVTKLIVFTGQHQGQVDFTSYTSQASAAGIQVESFSAFEERGVNRLDGDPGQTFETACKGRDRQPDDMCTIVFTSGSTGKPKGAIMTDQILRRRIGQEFLAPTPLVVVSYLPSAHSFDRESCLGTLIHGGRIAFHHGAVSDIFSTLQVVKPTTFSSTPRLWIELHQQFLDLCSSTQASNQSNGMPTTVDSVRKQCLASLRGVLGGRTKSIGTGGASTSPEVLQFMRDCFECSVVDGYGATEVGAISWDGVENTASETKLIDRPEMGYTADDKPFPRGEICVRSPVSVQGYYKNEVETSRKFTPDGWYRTGDIGEKRSAGYVRVIDRVSDLFKLSGGEFVAPARLEQTFETEVLLVSQCWVTGMPNQASPVAVVVPAPVPTQTWASTVGPPHSDMSLRELCQDSQRTLAVLIHGQIAKVAVQRQLPTHERPGLVLLVADPFTVENEALTTTRKLRRQILAKRYAKELQDLLLSTDSQASSCTWSAELESIADGPMKRIMRAASVVLPLPPLGGDSSPGDWTLSSMLLSDWLPDSIAAVRLAASINAEFGRGSGDGSRLLPSALLDPAATLEHICTHMTARTAPAVNKSVRMNWELESKLEASLQFTADAGLGQQLQRPGAHHVLVTGSTGFLGAFVLAELLNSSACTVTCLVRGASWEEAYARLRSTLSGYGLLESQSTLTGFVERVTVLVGDIARPGLGISELKRAQLLAGHDDCLPIDTIVHCAARVSSVAPYVALQGPNVDGTTRLLQLASDRPAGRVFFCYISTIGVVPVTMVASETDSVPPEHLDSISGYNQSKWVAERRVLVALKRGLPGCVIRPANIFGHSSTGASNATDVVVRLLRGVCDIGSAPYLPLGSQHFQDITAVDDLARAVVGTLLTEPGRTNLQGCVMNMTAAAPTLTEDLFGWVDSYRLARGHVPLKRQPLTQWVKDLQQAPHNALNPFSDMIAAAGLPAGGTAGRDRSFAASGIARMGLVFSPITESSVHSALAWLDSGVGVASTSSRTTFEEA